MIRTVTVTLAALAAIDHLMFGGTYIHIAGRVADNILHFLF
jgi:hypothetical protein